MSAYLRHLEQAASENADFRRVIYTTSLLQVCVMCLMPHEDMGSRLHDADHFYLVVQGGGTAVVDGVALALSAGYGLLSPAGCTHNIANTGTVPMKACEVVAPPHYRQGAVHSTRAEAQADEDPFELGLGAFSASGEAQANWVLGLLALHGIGVPLDKTQACRRFERANQLGHPLASAGLAWCATSGVIGAAQAGVARDWLSRLGAVNPGRALYLEWFMEQELGPTLAARARGTQLRASNDKLLRAAKAGDAQALLELGLQSAQKGRLAHALDYFRRAASRSPAAAVNVAVVRQYLQARGQPLHQSMPALQRDPTPLFDLLPGRWRRVRGGITPSAPGARATVAS